MKTKQSSLRSHVITRMFVLLVALFAMQGLNAQTAYNSGKLAYKYYSDGHAEVVGLRSGYESTTSVVIPASLTVDGKKYPVTKIADKAFENNNSIQSIGYSPEGSVYNLTDIGSYAFAGCINLTLFSPITSSATNCAIIPNSVTLIQDGAFAGCTSIKGVKFLSTSKCKGILNNAFVNCGAEYIDVPASVKTIGARAFVTKGICKVTFNNADWVANTEGTTYDEGIFNGNQTVTFGPNVTHIGERRFVEASMKELIIPSTVKYISKDAFGGCVIAKTTINTNEVDANGIDKYAFSSCTGQLIINADKLTDFELASTYFSTWTVNAWKIVGTLIQNNTNIRTLEIPNLEQFDGQIFANCPNLSTIKANESRFKVMAPAKYPESKGFYSADGTVLYTALPTVRNIRLLPQCVMIHGEAFNPAYHTVMDARDLERIPTLTGGRSSKVPAFVLVPADKAPRYAEFAQAGAEIVETSTGKQFDANGDGVISIGDVAWVVNKVLGKATINDADFVDLGLPSGTLWAKTNLGASSESALGNNYQWADTKPCSTTGTESNYCWYDAVSGKYTKYNDTDHLIIMDDKDDAAVVAGKGRIPSIQQFGELFEKCSVSTETINGIDCYRLKGPNGSSIILPQKTYWTNSRFSDGQADGYEGSSYYSFWRFGTCQIRPVK